MRAPTRRAHAAARLLLALGLAVPALVVGACSSERQLDEDLNVGSDAPLADARPDAMTPDARTCEPQPERGYRLEVVASGLEKPLFLAAPPGEPDRFVVVEQGGLVHLFVDGERQPEPFIDITKLTVGGGERGLLGLAFHPGYAKNRRVFISYTDVNGDSHVDELSVPAPGTAADPASRKNILFQDQPYANHNGGMITFGPDGYLYIGFGDGGSGGDPQGNGQNMRTWLGKMLRIDVDATEEPYAIPPDNPFVGDGEVLPEIWASGLRNPWRFSFDAETGDLYIADVGQGQYEEVHVTPAGQGGVNYGWNLLEGPECFRGGDCEKAGLALPATFYDHGDGCSITGGYVYRGCAIPELRGRYFYADYCTGLLRSFRWEDGQAVDEQDHTAELRGPANGIASFGEDGAGELYIVDHAAGEILRFVPAS